MKLIRLEKSKDKLIEDSYEVVEPKINENFMKEFI